MSQCLWLPPLPGCQGALLLVEALLLQQDGGQEERPRSKLSQIADLPLPRVSYG